MALATDRADPAAPRGETPTPSESPTASKPGPRPAPTPASTGKPPPTRNRGAVRLDVRLGASERGSTPPGLGVSVGRGMGAGGAPCVPSVAPPAEAVAPGWPTRSAR